MEDKKVFIGIDFSLISPSVCILKDEKIKFISFFNDYGKNWKASKSKTFQYHRVLNEGIVEMIPYTRNVEGNDYREEQISKMKDARKLADLITDKLKNECKDCEVKIGLEGFSFGSSGASYIDLIMYNCFLRQKLIEVFGEDCLVIISPTEGKKHFSGKGNANKEKMIEAFIDNFVGDNKIEKTELWNFCKNNDLDYKNIKPIDDLIDSCGILESIQINKIN